MSSSPHERGTPFRATWNTPEDIAKHRGMTPGERIKKTVALSQETARLARKRGVPFDQILFELLNDEGEGEVLTSDSFN